MENQNQPEQIIQQGADAWNRWRRKNSSHVSFNRPSWYTSRDAQDLIVKGNNDLDLSGIDLSGVSVIHAFAEGLNLRGATISDAEFDEGDFSRADFSGAVITNTRFNKTIFTDANFDGATIKNCNLNRVNLTNASFCVQEISQTVVYGISAWDLRTCDEMKQSELVIERSYELYSDIIADYNREKDRVTIEETFAKLVDLANSVDAEQRRAAEEGLSEEDLALFDLVSNETLSKVDRERVKQASLSLLASMQKLIESLERWTDKEQTQAEVETSILDHGFLNLPSHRLTVHAGGKAGSRQACLSAHLAAERLAAADCGLMEAIMSDDTAQPTATGREVPHHILESRNVFIDT